MSRPELITCDLAVVGAGAAGLAAAVHGASLGLDVALVTRGRPGGRIGAADRIPLVDGFPVGLCGRELVERAAAKARALGVRVMIDAEVRALEEVGPERGRLHVADGRRIDARAVIVATGVDRSIASVEGAHRLVDAGVHTRMPGRGEGTGTGTAYVAGCPSEAARAALVLSGGGRVVVVTREPRPARLIPEALLRDLRACPNVAALPYTEVVGVDGVDRLEVVVLRDTRSGRLRVRTATSLWLPGVERARTGWVAADIARDDSGRLTTGGGGRLASETSRPGVFAAGDVRAGAPTGLRAIEDGIDTAEQAQARLRLGRGDVAAYLGSSARVNGGSRIDGSPLIGAVDRDARWRVRGSGSGREET